MAEVGDVVLDSVADSLAALELRPVRRARRLADLGSGAGFPGLVLAAALRKRPRSIWSSVTADGARSFALQRRWISTTFACPHPEPSSARELTMPTTSRSPGRWPPNTSSLSARRSCCGPAGRRCSGESAVSAVWFANNPAEHAAASHSTGVHLSEIRRVEPGEMGYSDICISLRRTIPTQTREPSRSPLAPGPGP